jgi:hypothetical protein
MKVDLFYGKVESIEDPDRKGRIQVRVLPEMEGASKDDLPWVRSFLQKTMTDTSQTHDLPVEGSYVWCIFLDVPYFKDGWFISGVFVDKSFDFDSVTQALSAIDGFSGNAYKDLHFTRHEDGTIIFRNPNTKEAGFLSSTGTYLFVDQNGATNVYAKGAIKVSNDNASVEIESGAAGNVIVDPGAGNIQLAGSTDSLVKYSQLASIIRGLKANLDARIMIDPLSGVTGTVNPGMASDVFDPMAQTNLTQMEATKVKTG